MQGGPVALLSFRRVRAMRWRTGH